MPEDETVSHAEQHEGTDRKSNAMPRKPAEQADKDDGPKQVKLFFDGERPEMGQHLLTRHATDECPVENIEHGAEDFPETDDGFPGAMQDQFKDNHEDEEGYQWGKETQAATGI